VQLAWRASPADGLELRVGDQVIRPEPSPPTEVVLDRPDGRRRRLDPHPGGPGSVVLTGLAPGRSYEVEAAAEGWSRRTVGRFRTLVPPPGERLCRFATVSDIHIGQHDFGVRSRLHDPLGPGATPFSVRALQAAMDEAQAWGARQLVVKGDLTRRSTAAEFRDAAALLARAPLPVEVILGNHDIRQGADARAILGQAGLAVPWQPVALDLPGIRLILVHSPHPDSRLHRGAVGDQARQRIVALAAEAPGAVWIGLHHPPQRFRLPISYPPGVPGHEAHALLDDVAAANPRALVSAGHSHRNRRRRHGPVVVTEVGSTKDYPGGWAGYEVYEGGIVQVVRRTTRPDVLAWTEGTRRAVNGLWGWWSPGQLDERCFSLTWAP
jgi:Icc protein